MRVPFLDLRAQHDPLRAELIAAFQEVVDSSAFAGGPFVARFEEDFAAFCGTSCAVGVGSGTEALWLALLARGIGPGDEVVTVPNSFLATAEAISFTGATPVFVDVDERTYTLDPARLEAALTPRTRAVIPVHLYGQMADMDPIMEIAGRHGLFVLEDACQAHGAEYKGRRAGSIGHAGAFSFYPGKNLGALGEAGAVTTGETALADRIKCLRDHGQARKYHHAFVGWNGRMDGIQAAALRIKLRHLARGNAARRAHAHRYDRLLSGIEGVIAPFASESCSHVYHLYVVRVAERDRILAALAQRGVACAIHYPTPIHLQGAYQSLGYGPGSFPVAESQAEELLSLPMFPELAPRQVEFVVGELRSLLCSAKPVEGAVA
jgi:dTDP-4-amino-4,6-dideoxygalactose transaminase